MLNCQKDKFNLSEEVSYINCAYMSPNLKAVEEVGIQAILQKSQPWKVARANFFDPVEKLKSTFAKLIWSPRYNLALEHRLKRLSCPSLVVKAENDRLIPNEMADRFAEVLPSALTTTIPETGHALCIERPNETADAILAFIKESGNE